MSHPSPFFIQARSASKGMRAALRDDAHTLACASGLYGSDTLGPARDCRASEESLVPAPAAARLAQRPSAITRCKRRQGS